MMKAIIIVLLFDTINAAYPDRQCYICDVNGCDHPGSSDVKSCSDNGINGTSGKRFVGGALGLTQDDTVYQSIQTNFDNFGANVLQLNSTTAPKWEDLTHWVCYVTKNKRRGCMVMGKGLCSGDKSWWGQLTDIGNKITGVMQKAKDSVGKMFSAISNSGTLTDNQKLNISHWIAEDYMGKLINNTNGDEYQLETCCEGNSCNFASMIQKSTVGFILFLFSTFMLV